jgi:hypothetical protein
LGLQASAIAIITRWRMPPESWWGYCAARRSGSGICTRRSISIARASAAARVRPWCSTRVSRICRPIVSTGLSDVIGSWKIIEISLPRIVRISASESDRRSRSPKRIEPPTMRPGGQAISRRIDIAVTLLPQPDSPTTASVSPASTWIDTPSTARVMPSRVKNQVRRSWISSSA